MRVLITGFTSRGVGSGKNLYNYVNVEAMVRQALEAAGHEVDHRAVSITEDNVGQEYDVALVNIAVCQGLSSSYRLGALWTLAKFGRRAGLFPGDGQNMGLFPKSVLTCLRGTHLKNGSPMDPIDFFLGGLFKEGTCNIKEVELGREERFKDVWRGVLTGLPHGKPGARRSLWPWLITTFPWGRAAAYEATLGGLPTLWDPSAFAWPHLESDTPDRRLIDVHTALNTERPPVWVLAGLQDNSKWVAKQGLGWTVRQIGNKRRARAGLAEPFIPEDELFRQVYPRVGGILGFGYPAPARGPGAWWRTRLLHAALAGTPYVADAADRAVMPGPYTNGASVVERMNDAERAYLAWIQHNALRSGSWSRDLAISTVDTFVKGLV